MVVEAVHLLLPEVEVDVAVNEAPLDMSVLVGALVVVGAAVVAGAAVVVGATVVVGAAVVVAPPPPPPAAASSAATTTASGRRGCRAADAGVGLVEGRGRLVAEPAHRGRADDSHETQHEGVFDQRRSPVATRATKKAGRRTHAAIFGTSRALAMGRFALCRQDVSNALPVRCPRSTWRHRDNDHAQ